MSSRVWKGESTIISPHAALRLVLKHARPLQRISKPLDDVLGYCLAEDIRADRDMPPADRSAMDGYALRSADLAMSPCVLRLKGEVAAGSPARPKVASGTCVRILTGGNIPPGADTVVMVEQTEQKGRFVRIRGKVEPGANILKRGEDARKGATLLRKGTVIGPLQVGVCAGVGKATVKVHRRPRVAVLCTGEELRDVADRVRAHEIRNSNGPAICAALAQWGYGTVTYRSVPDDPKRLGTRLRRQVAGHDVILMTGGVSVGKYDFVREAVERIGAAVRFHGVAMKPGKPLLYATLPGNRHIFGLPGNPLSAVIGFYEFAVPALRRLSGLDAEKCRPLLHVPLGSRLTSKGGRVRFVPARILWEGGGPVAAPVKSKSSADLVAGGRSDGVIAVPADVMEMEPGDVVEFRPWSPLP